MNERYLGVQIFRFYIRCTRCSSELVFKTDPQHQDYVCERGATRNFEQWRGNDGREETVDERLDRLQAQEERELQSEEQDSMRTLEAKADNAKREMAIADALDSIRMRNALQERVSISTPAAVDKNEDLNRVNEEAAREAFRSATDRVQKRGHDLENLETWKPSVKKKKDYAGLLVIKRSGK